MTDRFRLALIGTGQIACAAHIPAVLESPRIELAAVVDSSKERAERTVRDFKLNARVAVDIDDVRGDVDGVLIATPNDTHAHLAMRCLKLGLPVLIEKPLATTVDDGQAIVEAARQAGVLAAVGYCTRFWDNVRLMGELLGSGYFGAVRRFAYQLGMADWAPPVTMYSFNRSAAGGGVLIVNGSHFLDRMLHWFGYPDDIEYRDDSLGGPEANCVARLGWSKRGGLTGTIRLSKSMPLSSGLALDTEAGVVVMKDDPAAAIVVHPHDRSIRVEIDRRDPPRCADSRSSFRLQLEDFAEATRLKRQPAVTAEKGLESLRLIEALYACRQPLEDSVPCTVPEVAVQ